MSKIIAVALLLILLVDVFSDTTVSASSAVFHVSKVHIHKCGCRVFRSGEIKCQSPLLPTNNVKKQDLVKCFCGKRNQNKFPEFQAICRSWIPKTPI